jgi:hypothetical protein
LIRQFNVENDVESARLLAAPAPAPAQRHPMTASRAGRNRCPRRTSPSALSLSRCSGERCAASARERCVGRW